MMAALPLLDVLPLAPSRLAILAQVSLQHAPPFVEIRSSLVPKAVMTATLSVGTAALLPA